MEDATITGGDVLDRPAALTILWNHFAAILFEERMPIFYGEAIMKTYLRITDPWGTHVQGPWEPHYGAGTPYQMVYALRRLAAGTDEPFRVETGVDTGWADAIDSSAGIYWTQIYYRGHQTWSFADLVLGLREPRIAMTNG